MVVVQIKEGGTVFCLRVGHSPLFTDPAMDLGIVNDFVLKDIWHIAW